MVALVVNLGLLAASALWWRLPGLPVILPLLAGGIGVAGALLGAWTPFGAMQALAWGVFVYLPVALLARGRWLLALAALAVALDAFLVEPRWLEVSTTRVAGPPLRIALVADLQTDRVGDYERRVLELVRASGADLVLFAGDYVQADDHDAFVREARALAEAIGELRPSLGAFAVRGDVEPGDWSAVFDGTDVVTVDDTRTLKLRDSVYLTALSVDDSRSSRPAIPAVDGFHVVVGHAPDYALARPPANLLLAGHVHGGQVRLPGLGPLLTLSSLPRSWAAGHTMLPWGGDLVVSRGVGMERADAPRLRFLCRPELVLVDVGGG